ncbi:gp47 [Mycobacterium phage Bxz1]|uniref:Uncharacterized protein n=8 Tax=Bixzunavirus TaxID=680114 RepID=Q853N0_BPMBZ|nr:gp47 [Mycobacterium phage Bxz1]AAN16707.1 hypothetical protein PBI_BXZ1_47 [Mycobacterium phage Bxz1]
MGMNGFRLIGHLEDEVHRVTNRQAVIADRLAIVDPQTKEN